MVEPDNILEEILGQALLGMNNSITSTLIQDKGLNKKPSKLTRNEERDPRDYFPYDCYKDQRADKDRMIR